MSLAPAPWEMSLPELLAYQIPSPNQPPVRSLDPGASLSGYTPLSGDDLAQRLGNGTTYWDENQYQNARQGHPVKIWRAAADEPAIFPGAWVTAAKAVAQDHQRHLLKGGGEIREQYAHPDHLFLPPGWQGPQEFIWHPQDVARWHRGQILKGALDGKPVHPETLQEIAGDDKQFLADFEDIRTGRGPMHGVATYLKQWLANQEPKPAVAQTRLAVLQGLKGKVSARMFAELCRASNVPQARELVTQK
jgi:hypothetical protein